MTGLNAKRVAVTAAVGGGGLTVLTGASIGLVVAEAKLARRAIGNATETPPRADGLFGRHLARFAPVAPAVAEPADGDPDALEARAATGTAGLGITDALSDDFGDAQADAAAQAAINRPLRFAILGDSTAAGYGVHMAQQTPGALLAAALAAHAGRPVLLANVARVGAVSQQLAEQVDALFANGPEHAPQVAAIMIGANDVTHRLSPVQAAEQLGEAVARLRSAGCEVVVGTCPDLGTIRPIQPPLRWLARRWSRRLAALQARAVYTAGGRSVPIGALLGPEFASRSELFGPDGFHPSAEGDGDGEETSVTAPVVRDVPATGESIATPPTGAIDPLAAS